MADFTNLDEADLFAYRVSGKWNTGYYIGIHYTSPRREGSKNQSPFWRGVTAKTRADFMRSLKRIIERPETRDIYIALGTQRQTQTMTTRDGKPFEVAWRAKENTVSFSTLFMDIDVKEGAYENTQEAIDALAAFIDEYKLPHVSMIVASGSGGLHVYWVLEHSIPADEWYKMSLALVNAGLKWGLKFDSQVTVDYARVLRIPGTKNYKKAEPTAVRLLYCDDHDIPIETMQAALEPYQDLKLMPSSEFSEDREDYSGPRPALRDIEEVRKHCGFIDNSLVTGGVDNDNPLRFLLLNIAQFCHDPWDTAWRMMHNRATLTEEEFEETFARVQETHLTNPRGFPRCVKIASAGAPECKECPLRGTIASPLSFVEPTQPVVRTEWTPCPPGYTMDGDGYYYKAEMDEDGHPLPPARVFPKPIKQPWLSVQDGEYCLQFVTTKAGSQPMPVTISLKDTVDKNSLSKALRSNALFSMKIEDMQLNFMASFIDLLQGAKEGIVDTKPFGWQRGPDRGFAFAGKNYAVDGVEPAPFPGEGLDIYGVFGEPEAWTAAAKAITRQKRPALAVILASSFAAPLVHLCGGDVEGFVIGAVSSHSGVGKTTTLNVAQAVWASPHHAKMGLSDTINSVFGKAGNLRHLPLIWDEIKGDRETKNFVNILFQLTGGKEKSRMSRSATVRESKTWSTLLVYGTNSSLSDALISQAADTVAGNMRLFEFTVPPITSANRDSSLARLVGELNENYGHAGAAYAAYIGPRQRELRDRLSAMREEWVKEVGADEPERFWVAACCTVMLGAELANRIGLTEFDLEELKEFLMTEHRRMQRELAKAENDLSNDDAVAGLLGDFLARNAMEHAIATTFLHNDKGKPPTSLVMLGDVQQRIRRIRSVSIHYGVKDRTVRIAEQALSDWCASRGLNSNSFISALKRAFGAVVDRKRLGVGTGVTELTDSLKRTTIEISFRGTILDEYIDDFLDALEHESA